MNALLIVGAGGHGRVVADAAASMDRWESISFVDDAVTDARMAGFEVIGRCLDLERLVPRFDAVAVGIGNASVRLTFIDRLRRLQVDLPVIVHRSAAVSPFAVLGAGTVVFAQAAVNVGARLGPGCIVNTGATVDHDCTLGAGVHACPGAHVAGDVRVGERTWIGIGSSIRNGIAVGSDVTIGAGAAVVFDIESSITVVGVPARKRNSSP